MKRLYSVALCCLALSSGPVQAGLFDDVEARRQIDTISQELRALRQDLDARNKGVDTRSQEQEARLAKLEAALQNQLLLVNQMEALKQELARVRGQIEVNTNELEQSQKRQKDFYVDLDARLRKLEGATTALTQPKPEAQPDQAAESADYQAALNAMRAKKALDAAFALRNFIKTYPKSALQPGAHFWLAAAYAQLRENESARDTFAKMASTWPDDPLAPDAMLGQATAQQDLKETRGARTTLEALVAKYPDSDAARTAKARLARK